MERVERGEAGGRERIEGEYCCKRSLVHELDCPFILITAE